MNPLDTLWVTCPRGLEDLLTAELKALLPDLANDAITPSASFVKLPYSDQAAYRICLWSRLANRVVVALADTSIDSADALYDLVYQQPWHRLMQPDASLRVDFTGTNGFIKNSQFGALKVKDAVVDQIRDQSGRRPNIDKDHPDTRVHVQLRNQRVRLGIDLSGDSLHLRGYRTQAGAAPLKETLAAALLARAGWAELAEQGALFDPMCGSGTLVLEAALAAANIAPGSLGRGFGFQRWPRYQPDLWQQLLDEAQSARRKPPAQPTLLGRDNDPQIIRIAEDNAQRAGVADWVQFDVADVADPWQPNASAPGLWLTNPPYGERLGDLTQMNALYAALGEQLNQLPASWRAGVLTSERAYLRNIPRKYERAYAFRNGPIDCELFMFRGDAEARRTTSADAATDAGVTMLANRLRKNQRRLQNWLKQEGITCYRLYDADIPEYAVAIDRYHDRFHVQEYQAPASIPADKARYRLGQVLEAIAQVFDVTDADIALKQRQRQRGKTQYQRRQPAREAARMEVNEGDCRFWVDLHSYLDTGLFLDHRPMRRWIQAHAQDQRVLNLFCYTGSVTVHAAKGGAASTVSVDMSATYLEWARENMRLNGFITRKHQFIEADCLQWLSQPQGEFDLIFLDPPTFSNSKKMQGHLDIQTDHEQLVRDAMAMLSATGVMVFSNNYRRFKLADSLNQDFQVEDISAQSIDPDFKRRSNIHHCYLLRHL